MTVWIAKRNQYAKIVNHRRAGSRGCFDDSDEVTHRKVI